MTYDHECISTSNSIDYIDLIGPSDVGGQCPSPTYKYTWAGVDNCCCGNGCCWKECTWSSPPANCIENITNSHWIYSQDLGYHKAVITNGKKC